VGSALALQGGVTERTTTKPDGAPRPGEFVKARVVAATDRCLWLLTESPALYVTVALEDVQWCKEIDPRAYGRIGEVLDVKLLRVAKDGRTAGGWLPWPRWHLDQGRRAWRGSWQPDQQESRAG